MRYRICAGLIALSLAATALAAPAHRFADAEFAHLDVLAARLGLTEQQEASINEKVKTFRLESAVDRERVAQMRGELHDLSRAGPGFDEAAAEALAADMAEILARMAVSAAELRWQLRRELTEEQLGQFDAWRGQRHHRPPQGMPPAFGPP